EGVEDDRGDQAGLAEPHDRGLVRADRCVVRLGGHADQRGVEHVHEQEEEDEHAGHAVRDPRPHAFSAAVQRACWCGGHFGSLLWLSGWGWLVPTVMTTGRLERRPAALPGIETQPL